MTLMSRFIEAVDVLMHPHCWVQVADAFSPMWDAELRQLLDSGASFSLNDRYDATIGPYQNVWIANHPYGSFTFNGLRPRRATILRAGRVLKDSRERDLFRLAMVKR